MRSWSPAGAALGRQQRVGKLSKYTPAPAARTAGPDDGYRFPAPVPDNEAVR